MVRPDIREAIWYDLNNILNIDANTMTHYWTIVFDKFKLIDDGKKRKICLACDCQDFVDYKNKKICKESIHTYYKNDGKKIVEIEQGHIIVEEDLDETIKRKVSDILNWLQDMNGYRMSLFELEDCMVGRHPFSFFETRVGDVTKGEIIRELSKVKDILFDRLLEIKNEIRFGASLNTPQLRM